ncbi:MAG: HAMP domain-containing sensor histidine kinase [Chitinophagaceae bacterium]
MKLLTKTTVYFLSALIFLLGVTGFFLYRQFSRQLQDRSDRELLTTEGEWVEYLHSQAVIGTAFILRSKEVSVYPTETDAEPYPEISDASDYTNVSGTKIPYRQLTQVISIGNINYQLVIKKSQEQKIGLINNFTRVILFVFAGLFIATLIFNWFISRKLWQPFHESLNKIRDTNLQQIKNIHFDKTNTQEFNELNESLNQMTQKIYSDFISMKEFTEDAAHEMQTPIAVVQSKLEILLQDNNLTHEQVESVLQSADALSRLSKLNQGLLFLAKIENNQFVAENELSFAQTSQKFLTSFSELIRDKQLTVETDFISDFKLKIHPLLADSIISNLVGNAIKYNYPEGKISLTTTADSLTVTNTSNVEAILPENLFRRFHSSRDNKVSSNGLGLAIVKKIADINKLNVLYKFANRSHSFTISKKELQG